MDATLIVGLIVAAAGLAFIVLGKSSSRRPGHNRYRAEVDASIRKLGHPKSNDSWHRLFGD